MEQVLHDLKSVQGVIGAFLINSKQQILSSDLPPVFKPPKLLSVGKSMLKIYTACKQNFPDVSELFVTFEESLIIMRVVVEKIFVVVICEPIQNANIISLSLNMVMDELVQVVDKLGTEPAAEAAPPQPAAETRLSAKELMASGPLVAELGGIQEALAKMVGPMAKIILTEAIDSWVKTNQPSKANLPKLIDSLTHELPSPNKVAEFKQMVAAFLPPSGK